MEDFERRCAYSLVHVETLSDHNMEVDHHNPTIKTRKLHAYGNLYPAISLCNNSKSGVWPKPKQMAQRLRFLDPCKEQDYGVHLFEDPDKGCELVAVSPEGLFHWENCDLNNEWLKRKRRERNEDIEFKTAYVCVLKADKNPENQLLLSLLQPILDRMQRNIPSIPRSLPGARIID